MTEDTPLPYTNEDINLIPRIGQNTKIRRVMVVESSYKRNEILDAVPGLQMTVGMEHKTTAYVNMASKEAWSYIDFRVTSKPNAEELKNQICFQIDVRLEVRYLYDGDKVTKKDLQKALNAMCHTSALLHGWAFIRQHIHDAMSRMLLPPLELPLLTLPLHMTPKPDESTPTAKKRPASPKKK